MFLSLYTNILPEQAFPVLSCQQQNQVGGGGLGTEVSTYVAGLLKLQFQKYYMYQYQEEAN